MATAWDKLNRADLETITWDAIYNARALVTDPDDARNLADRVTNFVKLGETTLMERKQKELALARKQKRLRIFWNTVFTTIIVAVVGGIALGAFAIIKMDANDYADVDPNAAPIQASAAIVNWFGQKTIEQGNLYKIGETHSTYLGKKAWYVKMADRDGTVYCSYVWSGQSGDYSGGVAKGAECK